MIVNNYDIKNTTHKIKECQLTLFLFETVNIYDSKILSDLIMNSK